MPPTPRVRSDERGCAAMRSADTGGPPTARGAVKGIHLLTALALLLTLVASAAWIVWRRAPMWYAQHAYELQVYHTALHIGLAAIKHEQCFGALPATVDDLIAAGLLVPTSDGSPSYVPVLGTVTDTMVAAIEFRDPAGRQDDGSFLHIDVDDADEWRDRATRELIRIRKVVRQGQPTGEPVLDRWLADCDAIRLSDPAHPALSPPEP